MRFVTTVRLDNAGDFPGLPSANNGSMTLLRFPARRAGVTCHHVIEAYREQRLVNPSRLFQVGGFALDPLDRLLAADPIHDLAVIDLEDVDPKQLTIGLEKKAFFEPAEWPLGTAEPGELIALGGYPGFSRAVGAGPDDDSRGLCSGPVSLGVTRVIDVGSENIVCKASWEYRVEGSGPQVMGPDADLGGLSGGGGFVRRGSAVYFVGVIFVVAQSRAYLRLRPARLIGEDGMLGRG
jgi:hypothetical protein